MARISKIVTLLTTAMVVLCLVGIATPAFAQYYGGKGIPASNANIAANQGGLSKSANVAADQGGLSKTANVAANQGGLGKGLGKSGGYGGDISYGSNAGANYGANQGGLSKTANQGGLSKGLQQRQWVWGRILKSDKCGQYINPYLQGCLIMLE